MHFSNNEKINALVESLRYAEEKARNKAAHTIVSITNERVVSWTKCTAEELIKKIQQLALFAGVAEEQSVWNSYVDMNQSILEEIKGENIF